MDDTIIPSDIEKLRPWFSLIRHLNSITVVGAPQFISTIVFVDERRQPQMWGAIERFDAFPRYRRIEIKESGQ